jgi:RNA polymerase sigma-70 factor (ECF subfamily)
VSSIPSTPDNQPAAQTGADRWFLDEVNPHHGQLKAYLRGSFPAVRDVDDVVQESYLRVWKVRATQPIESAKAFLFRVARNVALDALRKTRNSPLDQGRDFAASCVLDSEPDAATALITKELIHHLADALVELPDRWRQVLVLHKLKGMPQKEVAACLGLSDRTVEKYCLKGMARCADFMRARGIAGFFE